MAMPGEVNPTPNRGELLANPDLRDHLKRFVRGRVPDSDLDDVVQATLADAFAAARAPDDPEELRRWVFGIAKNKIADTHRRGRREMPNEDIVANHEAEAESAPLSARELLLWAQKELPPASESKSTLEWMLREGDGEKLEHIAQEEKVPAARIRQRVSRLRKHYRARWAAQLAAVAALAVLALAVWAIWRGRAVPGPDQIASEKVPAPPPVPTPEERAKEIRRFALERCRAEDWEKCVDELDRAKAMDPVGDRAPEVQEARSAAGRASPPPLPVPSASSRPPVEGQKLKPKAPTTKEFSGSDFPDKKPPPAQQMETPKPKSKANSMEFEK